VTIVIAVGSPQTFRGQVARALDVAADQVEWVPSVIAAEEVLGNATAPVDLVVVSPGVKELDAIGFAEFVTRSSPVTPVVLVREGGMNGSFPDAMRAGIRDVVDLTRGGLELRESLARAMTWSSNLRSAAGDVKMETGGHRGVVVSVFSSKGGTGKTTLTSNLAAAIAAQSGKDTAILDLELELGDVHAHFGQEAKLTVADLLDIGNLSRREEIIRVGTAMGEHLWGFGAQSEPGMPPIPGESIGKVLRAMRGAFPFTVVDASASYTDHALASFDVSDIIFLITALDVVAVRHLSIAFRTLLSLGVPQERFRVILNRADSKVGLAMSEVERVMRVRVEAGIPSSRLVPLSLNSGEPVYIHEPKSAVAKSFGALADKVIAMAHEPVSVGSQTSEKSNFFRKR
jgi:pilus assembly protein CpaE